MKTSFVAFPSLIGLMFISALPAFSQENGAEGKITAPVELKMIWGLPKIEVLEVEDGADRRVEKWREKVLVVFGYVPSSPNKRDVVTAPLVWLSFNLELQTGGKKADLDRRFTELKAELSTITSAEPQLKKWDSCRWTSKGEVSFPSYSSSTTGWVSYTWLSREFRMEGVLVGKKTVFKAKVTTSDQSFFVGFGPDCKFDFEKGEVIHSHKEGRD